MKIETRKISELKPNPKNPRQSTKKQGDQLKASLTKFGIVEPVIFNNRTGHIVGGHFRVRELKKLGYKEVPCVIVDIEEKDEDELNIRLNANTGEWDWDILANEWDSTELIDWGLDVPTIDVSEDLDQTDLSDNLNNKYILEIECDSEAEQEIMYNRFLNENLKVKISNT